MNVLDAVRLGHQEANKVGLGHIVFEIDRARRRLGRCKFKKNNIIVISLSRYWVEQQGQSEVLDTIKHELAHALAGPRAGHGPEWIKACAVTGATPERCATTSNTDKEAVYKYKATCTGDGCHSVMYFNRMGKYWKRGAYRCRKCKSPFKVNSL